MAAGISETGAQLFARLGTKPSLESLDSNLFQPPDFLRPGSAAEMYGPSGCGKTEILLHLVSNCILPKVWRGAELGGMGVGVILVDADYQFSMLRLFHILERRIVDVMERAKGRKGELDTCREVSSPSPSTESVLENTSQSVHQVSNDGTNTNNTADNQNVGRDSCVCNDPSARKQTSIGKKRTRAGEIKTCNVEECNNSRTEEQVDSNTRNNCFDMPAPEQTEAFIKTCLDRFYLVRAGGGSDQLIVTLHSLEPLIVNRPDVSVLMLENIAAFYWIDRMNGGVASTQEANQRKAVSVIKRLIGEYQLVLVATKPALIQRNRRSFWKHEDPVTPTTHSKTYHSDYEHHEFMCNAWNKLITHRFVMKRHDRVVHVQNQVSTQSYYTALRTSPPSDHLCRFIISDKGVVHQ